MAPGESPSAGVYDAALHAWTSKRVLLSDTPPLVVSRRPDEHVSEGGDSGWTVGTGEEPGLGPDEFEWSPVGLLTTRFPDLDAVFRAGTGTWRWSTADARYVSAP